MNLLIINCILDRILRILPVLVIEEYLKSVQPERLDDLRTSMLDDLKVEIQYSSCYLVCAAI
jgi:hypothetical protein